MALDHSKLNNLRAKSGGGWTAQCPACREDGGDSAGVHLFVHASGAFNCICYPADKDHNRRIASLAGEENFGRRPDADRTVPAPVETVLRTVNVRQGDNLRAGILPTVYEDGEVARFERWYAYHDSAGHELYLVARYTFPSGSKKKKTFRQHAVVDGELRPKMDGVERVPFRLPEVLAADHVCIAEGEKDAERLAELGIVATCNAGGAGKWDDNWAHYFAGKRVTLCGDTDEPGVRHMDRVEANLRPVAREVKRIHLEKHKDISDALHGLGREEAVAFFTNLTKQPAEPPPKSKLSFRTPLELFSLTFDNSDNYLGDRMLAAGLNCVLAGPGGVGKSRLLMQIALCCITGRPFLDFPTAAQGKRWLILQTENSTRRLQHDLHLMLKSLDVSREEYEAIEQNLIIHTVEAEADFCMQLDVPGDAREIELAIQHYAPDFVVFDPLNTFASGDLNSDQDMRKVCTKISQLVKRSNPLRVPLVIHHALTGKNGAAKAIDWDRASFARNSKVLHAWTRSQFNLAPRHPDDNTKLILACGKCSDGKEFSPLGLIFDSATGLYSIDPTFDLAAFKEEMAGPTKHTIRTTTAEIADIVRQNPGLNRAALKQLVHEETGLCNSKAYAKISDALAQKMIFLDPISKTFATP